VVGKCLSPVLSAFSIKEEQIPGNLDMKDRNKTKEQLVNELSDLRRRVAQLELTEARRREAEDALRESEGKFQFIAENMADIVWTMDLNLRTNYVSPSIEKILGFTPQERMQQTVDEQVTPDSLCRIQQELLKEMSLDKKEGADPERFITIEVEYYHKNGSIVWLENNVKGIRDHWGNLIGLHGLSRNITERKQAHEERERLIMELQHALSQVKTLKGLLPICASCKKIRNDEGYWEQIEVYIKEHSEADFTHGICPECAKKIYPKYYNK